MPIREREVGSDYSNFISVYREIYRSLKMSHPNVSVGSGLSFDVFERRTPFAPSVFWSYLVAMRHCVPDAAHRLASSVCRLRVDH